MFDWLFISNSAMFDGKYISIGVKYVTWRGAHCTVLYCLLYSLMNLIQFVVDVVIGTTL